MSNALAISGVTAALQFYLNNMYNALGTMFGTTVTVSSQAPDLVQARIGGTATSQNQVNIFLHQVTHNAGYRNVGLPSLGVDGRAQLQVPPLALDLHYLLTVYGSTDWQAEALLGHAVLMLHQNPVLARSDISAALNALPTRNSDNPLSTSLGASGLAEQIEMIKITPSTLGREELAWVWTALKADYRPTYPFQVSVVLIQPQTAFTFALPVLSRNIGVQAGPPPQLLQFVSSTGQTAAAPGDSATLKGVSLTGASTVTLSNARLGINYPPIPVSSVTNSSVSFPVPDDPTGLPAGIYSLCVLFNDSSGRLLQTSNLLPFAVAPLIQTTPATTVTSGDTGTVVALSCRPNVLPSQSVSLLLGGQAVPGQNLTAPTSTLSFTFMPRLSSGPYLARLMVDGVASPVGIDWSATPPTFTGPMVTVNE